MKARLPQGYQNSAPNMNQMVRKAQKMQEDIGKIQEELAVKEFSRKLTITAQLRWKRLPAAFPSPASSDRPQENNSRAGLSDPPILSV